MKKIFTCIILTAMLSGPLPVHAQKLQIDVRKETVKLDSLLYGLFFEDINYGADGGIYAELIQNRSFEYFPVYGKQNDEGYKLHPMYAWGVLKSSDSAGQVYVTRSQPLNENNRNHIEIICLDGKSPIGIYNSGYDGIPLNQEERYDFSLYYRFENLDRPNSGGGEITVSLEDEDGEILDSVSFSVKRSAVIDAIFTNPVTSDLSSMSPLLEEEANNSATFKGLSGLNADRAYSLDKRTYDESMVGKLALSTGFSTNVGINRQTTIDMDIQGKRGYIKKTNPNIKSVTKRLSITEATTPFGSTRATEKVVSAYRVICMCSRVNCW